MPVWHGDKGKKKTGGKINLNKGKRKSELGSNPTLTKLSSKRKKKIVRVKGGMKKVRSLSETHANVYDSSTKESKKVRIIDIVKNPANPHFVRRGILTKGVTIETELGMAKVTSRPSQHGIVSAVLLKE